MEMAISDFQLAGLIFELRTKKSFERLWTLVNGRYSATINTVYVPPNGKNARTAAN